VLLAEPPKTQFDLFFSVFGIPVRVHPFFWLVSAIFGMGGAAGHPEILFIWMGAVFVSILVHELGHAIAMRYYGWKPSITLYAMGGLARYDSGYSSSSSSHNRRGNQEFAQIVIAAAGPAAGFALAAITALATRLSGANLSFELGFPFMIHWNLSGISSFSVLNLIHDLLFINIFWGLLNLLPVYPLDGGQISREVFMRYNSRDGMQKSLWLSVLTGAGLALFGLMVLNEFYIAILFAYLAFSSYQILKAYGGGGGFGGGGFGGSGRRPW